jgi:hypothetical protein
VRATPRAIDRWRSMWIRPSVIKLVSRGAPNPRRCVLYSRTEVYGNQSGGMYEMARRVQLVYVIAMKTNTFPFNNRRPRDLQAKPWGQSRSHRPRDASSHPLAVYLRLKQSTMR